MLQDIRFGLRIALKNKGVTGMAIACLAIGIGLNTMIFGVTDVLDWKERHSALAIRH